LLLRHWIDNQPMMAREIPEWANSPAGIKVLGPHRPLGTSINAGASMLRRIAARHPELQRQMPLPDFNKSNTLGKKDIHRNEPGSGRHGDHLGSHHFNPGTAINPPKPPMDQDKRL